MKISGRKKETHFYRYIRIPPAEATKEGGITVVIEVKA
jgi:hypothetical protein